MKANLWVDLIQFLENFILGLDKMEDLQRILFVKVIIAFCFSREGNLVEYVERNHKRCAVRLVGELEVDKNRFNHSQKNPKACLR